MKVSRQPDSFREKVSIDKMLSTIVNRIWIGEVRRELQRTNLRGSGNVCVSLFGALDGQVADLDLEFEGALRELLDHVKAVLSPQQKQIVDLRLEKRNRFDISSKLSVGKATINREIVSIKNAFVSRLGDFYSEGSFADGSDVVVACCLAWASSSRQLPTLSSMIVLW